MYFYNLSEYFSAELSMKSWSVISIRFLARSGDVMVFQ